MMYTYMYVHIHDMSVYRQEKVNDSRTRRIPESSHSLLLLQNLQLQITIGYVHTMVIVQNLKLENPQVTF